MNAMLTLSCPMCAAMSEVPSAMTRRGLGAVGRDENSDQPWTRVVTRIAAVLLLAALAVGCGGSGNPKLTAADTATVTATVYGHVVVTDGGEWAKGCDPYYSSQGHGDIRQGAQVVVENAAGADVATGAVGAVTRDPNVLGRCVFAFSVPKVPASAFYKIAVAGTTPVVTPRADAVSGAVNIEVP